MTTTKVYSITMPPGLAKQAEALAKKENRTMSELMREALRRYRQQPMLLDLREYIRQLAFKQVRQRLMEERKNARHKQAN